MSTPSVEGRASYSNGNVDWRSAATAPCRRTRYDWSRLDTSRRHSGWTAKLPSVGVATRRDAPIRFAGSRGASQKQQSSDGSPFTAPHCWQVFITVPFCAADVSPNGSRESDSFYQQRVQQRKNLRAVTNRITQAAGTSNPESLFLRAPRFIRSVQCKSGARTRVLLSGGSTGRRCIPSDGMLG